MFLNGTTKKQDTISCGAFTTNYLDSHSIMEKRRIKNDFHILKILSHFLLLLKTIKQLYYNLVLITGHNFSLVLHSFHNYIKLLRLTDCTFLLASVTQNPEGNSILCPPIIRVGHKSSIGLLVQIINWAAGTNQTFHVEERSGFVGLPCHSNNLELHAHVAIVFRRKRHQTETPGKEKWIFFLNSFYK